MVLSEEAPIGRSVVMRANILIVEDEGIVALDIRARLERLGYSVVGWLTRAEDVVSEVERLRPDLILLDIHLAGVMDGIEAALEVRQRYGTPVVFLTAHADPATLERARAANPLGYLRKPFDERDLHVAVELALTKAALDETRRHHLGFMERIFDAVPVPVAVVGGDYKVRRVNAVFNEVFAVAGEAAAGEFLGNVLGCFDEAQPSAHCNRLGCVGCPFRRAVDQTLSGTGVWRQRVEATVLREGRRRRLVLLVTASSFKLDGENLAVIILEHVTELTGLKSVLGVESAPGGLVGSHGSMQEVYRTIREVADVNLPVLIQGESGTGKELVAQAIHSLGERSAKPFVAVHCAALPEGVLESELFGHVKGSFTGAIRDKKGRFELADGGTIFLDELGELPLSMQVKLLRVLQEGVVEPVGGESPRRVDVRIVSATNRDLRAEVDAGRFRDDLFFRLCVIPITLPPLRDRVSDIPLLASHLVDREAEAMGRFRPDFSAAFIDRLVAAPWPGNVRELRNVLQFALVKCTRGPLLPEHLPPMAGGAGRVVAPSSTAPTRRRAQSGRLDAASVDAALRAAGGNRSAAAKALRVSRATLYRFLDANPETESP